MSDPGDTLYAWQVLDPRDGHWGLIAAQIPALGVSAPLVARSVDVVTSDAYRSIVEQHMVNTGHDVRLGRFDLAEVKERAECVAGITVEGGIDVPVRPDGTTDWPGFAKLLLDLTAKPPMNTEPS